jgi:hypothetical protein
MYDNYLKRLTNLVPRVFWEATAASTSRQGKKVVATFA